MPFAKNKNWKFIYPHLSYNLSTPEDNRMKHAISPAIGDLSMVYLNLTL